MLGWLDQQKHVQPVWLGMVWLDQKKSGQAWLGMELSSQQRVQGLWAWALMAVEAGQRL